MIFSLKLPWSQVGPVKPASHSQVNELDLSGIQVPCLLQTSDVHTIEGKIVQLQSIQN